MREREKHLLHRSRHPSPRMKDSSLVFLRSTSIFLSSHMAPPPLREAEAESATEGESNTQGAKERERGRERGALVLVWRCRRLLQLCTPVSISLNPILSSMCVCSTAEKGNGNKVILLHTAQRKRERQTGRE